MTVSKEEVYKSVDKYDRSGGCISQIS